MSAGLPNIARIAAAARTLFYTQTGFISFSRLCGFRESIAFFSFPRVIMSIYGALRRRWVRAWYSALSPVFNKERIFYFICSS